MIHFERYGRKQRKFFAHAALIAVLAGLAMPNIAGLAYSDDNGGEDAFSFVVFGDSRIPAYAPYDKRSEDQLDLLIAKVMKYGEPNAKPDYQSAYDPETLMLEKVVVPRDAKGGTRTIEYGRDGWPDVFVDKDKNGAQISLLATGQAWVYDNVVQEIVAGVSQSDDGPTFCLHTGDIVYFGFQGQGADESPYWRDFDRRFLSRLPEGGPGNLPARFFPALGNHESWGDTDIRGFREMFPYLKKYGFSNDHRIYYFDYKNARFICLDSGTMDPEAPAEWYKSRPGYGKQMRILDKWMQEAVKAGKSHLFLNFHYPVFCRSGFGPLPADHNPHDLLQSYADDIEITVFNGHVHATEIYKVGGVRYFVAGGGGGEQGLSHNRMPDDYPEDLYWKGRPRVLDYNYLIVRVEGEDLRVVLKRFRPNEFKPFSAVDVVPGLMD